MDWFLYDRDLRHEEVKELIPEIVGNKAKGRTSKRRFKKAKHAKISKNKHYLPLDMHTCVCVSGGKKCLFFRIFGILCFLETPVLRFALLPYS